MPDNNKQRSKADSVNPQLTLNKIGLVSHDYRLAEADGSQDFSVPFFDILSLLAEHQCDGVLFALYTLEYRHRLKHLKQLPVKTSLKAIFLEEYRQKKSGKEVVRFVAYLRTPNGWRCYPFQQKLVKLRDSLSYERTVIRPFLQEVKTQRQFGSVLLLLCGESNIVRYSPKLKQVTDPYRFLAQVSDSVTVILNPIHDRMTRFEMKLKRQFLSRSKRWVLSVWNKGKVDSAGRVRDGSKPAWTVFYNGQELTIPTIDVSRIESRTQLEIGIVSLEPSELSESP